MDELKYLNHLDLSSNEITFIDELYSNHNLTELYLHNNPISPKYGLVFRPFENHWPTVRNYFERQNEKDKVDIKLPVKVLLLGNHASGKSTLLQYLKTGKLDKIQKSTHILNIDFYNIDRSKNDSFNLPDAIFYDFGGQDYYHGLYKTFLSKDSLYLILWKNSTNENCCVVDTNGLTCAHFNLHYWFGQKKFLETEKWEQSGSPNPTYLIQSHFDVDGIKKSGIQIEENNVVDEMSLSLQHDNDEDLIEPQNKVKHLKLQAYKEEMDDKITHLKVLKQEPQWYIEFLSFIFNAPHSHIPYTLDEIFPHYKRLMDSDQEKIDFFIDDLEQLHYRGIILYYKDINPNIVWLSPDQCAEYIHSNLLSKDIIKNEFGKIDKSSLEEVLTIKEETYILDILKLQKVIFYDQIGNQYIVPGFLQLSSEDNYYKGLSKGKSSLQFVMKFEKYLPLVL
ncbi:MAG: leucine-rich repeat domain-containing protein [Saprospiraceae bacterium]|nr:leucine-rich repeat domain-containing protein [Saprospiraceae bacterium]